MRLEIDPQLRLMSLVPTDCTIWHLSGEDGEDLATARLSLIESSPEASLQLRLTGRRPRQQVQMLTIANRRDGSTFGRAVAVVQGERGRPFYLEAEVADHWDILSAEVEPADMLDDWYVFRQGEKQVVRIQLTRSLKPGEQVRLELDGRRASDAPDRSTVGCHRILRFREALVERELLLVETRQPQWLLASPRWPIAQIQADSLTTGDAELLPASWQGVLLDVTAAEDDTPIRLLPQQATFRGNVFVELAAEAESYRHRYALECLPTLGAVTELRLQFTRPIPPTARWTLRSPSGDLAVQPIWDDEQGDRRSCRVTLPAGLSTEFWLGLEYETPRDDQPPNEPVEPNGVLMSDATSSQGWVVLRGNPQDFDVESQGNTAVAFPVAEASTEAERAFFDGPSNAELPILGCYRIDPNNVAGGGVLPALVRKVPSDPTEAREPVRLFARRVDVHSQYAEDGATLHVATYQLESRGPRPGGRSRCRPRPRSNR